MQAQKVDAQVEDEEGETALSTARDAKSLECVRLLLQVLIAKCTHARTHARTHACTHARTHARLRCNSRAVVTALTRAMTCRLEQETTLILWTRREEAEEKSD